MLCLPGEGRWACSQQKLRPVDLRPSQGGKHSSTQGALFPTSAASWRYLRSLPTRLPGAAPATTVSLVRGSLAWGCFSLPGAPLSSEVRETHSNGLGWLQA